MIVDQIRPGLWRWTCRHPEWVPEEGGPEGWDSDVGCVYYEAPDAVVLVDPLLPSEAADREIFLRALDRDVERLSTPVAVVLTNSWHQRSASEVRERYPAWAGSGLPGDLRGVPMSRNGEVAIWIPAHGALVMGDVLLGDGAGGLRVCPDAWLTDSEKPADVHRALRTLLDLPVEMVLVSHGAPVLARGHDALAAALGA